LTRGLPPLKQIDNRLPKLTEAEVSNAFSILGPLRLPVKDVLATLQSDWFNRSLLIPLLVTLWGVSGITRGGATGQGIIEIG